MKWINLPVIITALFFSACGKKPKTEEVSSSSMLFEGNQRKDLSLEESSSIIKFRNSCTGFWITNRANKLIAATARHCLGQWEGKEEAACGNGYIKFFGLLGTSYNCKRIVLNDKLHDTFLMELEKADSATEFPKRPLTLTLMKPYIGVDLEMFGFPADSIRLGSPTKTGNCAMTGGTITVTSRNYPTAVPNNCSTWGGNSGGPMVLAGTTMVVGVPGLYAPGQKVDQPFKKFGADQAFHEDMGTLITRNRELLKKEKIDVIELSDEDSVNLAYKNRTELSPEEVSLLFQQTKKSANSSLLRKRFSVLRPSLLNYTNPQGFNFLHLAFQLDDLELIRLLLETDKAALLLQQKTTDLYAPYHFVSTVAEYELLAPTKEMIFDESKYGSLLGLNFRYMKSRSLQERILQDLGPEFIQDPLFTKKEIWSPSAGSPVLREQLVAAFFRLQENFPSVVLEQKNLLKKLKCENLSSKISYLGVEGENVFRFQVQLICGEVQVEKFEQQLSMEDLLQEKVVELKDKGFSLQFSEGEFQIKGLTRKFF